MPSSNQLKRTYLLNGLDRVLYASAPAWREGTFEQSQEEVGRLVLHADDLASPTAVNEATQRLDRIAERFRLAVSKRTGCPLTLKLEKSEEPDFSPPGVLRARDTVRISAYATCTVLPREPPDDIEQISEGAARWITTLTETKRFSGHPDEVAKRLYLLIEEFQETYASALSDDRRAALPQVKWVRNFVSHPTCSDLALCRFIATHLPNAVVSVNPLRVRFDRTQVEHRNFVGRHNPVASEIAGALLNAAIAKL